MDLKLEDKIWWNYIEEDLQELLVASEFLSNVVRSWGGDMKSGSKVFHDYSFMVFPAAKAYEGYLKKIFVDKNFITQADYDGKKFRIGKSLNPFLEKRYRVGESVYDKIVEHCGGKELADKLWEAWIKGRNSVFHWFPNEKTALSFSEAEERINLIIDAMDSAFEGCKIN